MIEDEDLRERERERDRRLQSARESERSGFILFFCLNRLSLNWADTKAFLENKKEDWAGSTITSLL